jgi:hypothetical protein
MADFKMCEPFGIDDGELDGLSPQQCFVLGVEWQKFYDIALRWKAGTLTSFKDMCHSSENLERIKALLERHGVPYRVRWLNDDWNEIEG